MKCPRCGDKCTGVTVLMQIEGVMYDDFEIGDYPELAAEAAHPHDTAICMDCEFAGGLAEFYPEWSPQ